MGAKKIICVIGTRPEAIKMVPVILALSREPWVDVRILATAQHRHLLDQVLESFALRPDLDLNIMQSNQPLTILTARLMTELDQVFISEKPDAVLVQGDTTTVMTAALACFYHHIPVGHIEAGLRTWDMYNPFPEEINRVISDKIARWHFAPTEEARQNLLKDGVNDAQITVSGNTVIDTLLMMAKKNPDLPEWLTDHLDAEQKLILVTCHRRENFGAPLEHICQALQVLAQKNPGVFFLFPAHPNPNVQDTVHRILGNIQNFMVCQPLDYIPFIAVMKRSYLILTDSGGVQEEAPALGKPVLVMREETERPEAVTEGVVKLVGSSSQIIIREVQTLLDNVVLYQAMARGISPYGVGHAAGRIVTRLRTHFMSETV